MKHNKVFASIMACAMIVTGMNFSNISNNIATVSATTTRRSIDSYIGNDILTLVNNNNYYISPKCATNSVLDIDGRRYTNGTNCHLWGLHYGLNQQFKFVNVGSDSYGKYFIIKPVYCSSVLDVSGGIVRNGQNVQLYQRNNTRAQQWYIKKAENGYYYIESRLNRNYVLDVSGAGRSDGTNIHIYQKNYTNAQKFSFNTCNHSNTKRFSRLTNDWSDMIWLAGTECKDCGAVLSHGTWTLPN